MNQTKSVYKWFESIEEDNEIIELNKQNSRKLLLNTEYPNRKNEEWRLTNLKRLDKFTNLPLSNNSCHEYKDKYPSLQEKEKNLLQIIIEPIKNPINDKSLPKGIKKLSNKQLEIYLGGTIRNFKCKDKWPILLNKSTANQVIGLEIKGKDLPTLEIVFPATSDSLNSTRVILIVEEDTDLELIEFIIGNKNSAQSNLIEMRIGKNSNVNHSLIALGGGEGNLLCHMAVEQDIGSDYSLIGLQEGWYFSRFEPYIIQKEGQAKTTLKGLQISTEKQQSSTHSFVQFNGPNGQLEQLNKSAATGNSHSIFNGAIVVPKVAQKTEASQLSRNLLLSKRARIDTKPELEIIADDVRCTHGATISQLQEEELFYLRSRGISSNSANSLLLEGYYKEILNALNLSSKRLSFLNDLLLEHIK